MLASAPLAQTTSPLIFGLIAGAAIAVCEGRIGHGTPRAFAAARSRST